MKLRLNIVGLELELNLKKEVVSVICLTVISTTTVVMFGMTMIAKVS